MTEEEILEEAMRKKAKEQPNRSNPTAETPTCQVDTDGHSGPCNLMSVQGVIAGSATTTWFNVWICEAHRDALQAV